MGTPKRRRVASGVYELQRGVYELVVSAGRRVDGRHRQRTQRFRGTAGEAKRVRARMLAQVESNEANAESSSMTFAVLLNRHVDRLATTGASPYTVADYRGLARNHLEPVLGHVPIDRLRTLDFDTLYDDLTTVKRLRLASIRKIHNLARGALRQALRWGLVQVNVAAAAALPTIRRPETRVPSPEDVQKLILTADEPWATLLRVAVGTGLRRGELVALRWSDVDSDQGTIRVRAGSDRHRRRRDREADQNGSRARSLDRCGDARSPPGPPRPSRSTRANGWRASGEGRVRLRVSETGQHRGHPTRLGDADVRPAPSSGRPRWPSLPRAAPFPCSSRPG